MVTKVTFDSFDGEVEDISVVDSDVLSRTWDNLRYMDS
jgi:hypothetical protein